MRGCRSDWLEAQRAVGQGRSPGKVGFPTKWIRNAAYPDDPDTNHDAGFDYPDLLWRVLIGRIVLEWSPAFQSMGWTTFAVADNRNDSKRPCYYFGYYQMDLPTGWDSQPTDFTGASGRT